MGLIHDTAWKITHAIMAMMTVGEADHKEVFGKLYEKIKYALEIYELKAARRHKRVNLSGGKYV